MTACNIAGPAYPEKSATETLQKEGFSDETIGDVVRGRPLSEELLNRLMDVDDRNIDFLLARNTHIAKELMATFASSDSLIVRMGVASNREITDDIALSLVEDKSMGVLIHLASNPKVSDDVRNQLRAKGVDDHWFPTGNATATLPWAGGSEQKKESNAEP